MVHTPNGQLFCRPSDASPCFPVQAGSVLFTQGPQWLTFLVLKGAVSNTFEAQSWVGPSTRREGLEARAEGMAKLSMDHRVRPLCNVGDLGSIPGLGGSPGGGLGNPLQYSCLENPHRQRSLASYSPCRGLCRGAVGNPRVPRLLPGTLGNFPGCL